MVALHPGCTTTGSRQSRDPAYASETQVRAAVGSGPATVRALSAQLTEIHRAFVLLASDHGEAWRKRGYLTSWESDQMEELLFRFVTAQDFLMGIAGALGGKQPARLFPDEELRTAAHVLVMDAQFLLLAHRAEWIAEFASDPVAVAKLNEAFFRSEIPAGTYDAVRLSVTSHDVTRRLQAAWVLFEHATQDDEIKRLVSADPTYADLVAAVPEDYQRAQAGVEKLRSEAFVNTLEHSEAVALARQMAKESDEFKYKVRCLLFKDLSRLKNPLEQVIQFSPAQHAQVNELLQPGDLILTYTAGYMSDVFIPGRFKHGITFIGTPAQREAAGIDAARLPDLARPEQATVERAFDQSTLKDGQQADVIEAVAEGVIFNNLAHIMDTHVNRLVVLRPKLSAAERADFLAGVFAFHGDPYDFLFDFGNASRQVCTEVIYRGLSDKGGINFPLTPRGGHPTLSADDIVNYHFKTAGRHFDIVLYAKEDLSQTGHHAVVFTGPEGEQQLKALMGPEIHPPARP